MGRRGPLPKPTHIKIAAGNPGKRRLNDAEPVPPAGEVVQPNWLTEKGGEIWAQMAPIALSMKTLTVADTISFGRYCETVARYIELNAFLMRKGPGGTTYVRKDSKGKVLCWLEIPQAAEYRRLHELLKSHEDAFGFNPGARARLRFEPAGGAPVVAPIPAPAPLSPEDIAKQDFFRRGGPEVPPAPTKKPVRAV